MGRSQEPRGVGKHSNHDNTFNSYLYAEMVCDLVLPDNISESGREEGVAMWSVNDLILPGSLN